MRPLYVPPVSNEVYTEPIPMADQRLIDTLTLTGRMDVEPPNPGPSQTTTSRRLGSANGGHSTTAASPPSANSSANRSSSSTRPPYVPRPTYYELMNKGQADWLSVLNRRAVEEGWNDDIKRQIKIGKISGPALQWHDLNGNQHATWLL